MTRGQWTLVGLLIVQAALIAVLRQPAAAGPSEARPLVSNLDPATIDRIEVGAKSDERIVLQREGEDWAIATADGFPADASKVRDLLDKVRDASVRTPVVTSSRYHDSLQVSEENAEARIRLHLAGAGAPAADIILGKSTGEGTHIRLAGDDEVYDVAGLSTWSLRPEAATWMQRTLVDLPIEAVTRVDVSNANGMFTLERADDEWIVVSPEAFAGRSCLKDKVDAIVRSVASLSAADAAGRLDPATQGLGDEATSVTLRHEGGSVTVRFGSTVPDRTSHVYVTRDGFPFAATQWASSLEGVKNAKLDDLLP